MVPLDGSDLAERALPMAEQLAARAGAEVVLARAPLARVVSGMDAIDPARVEADALADAETYLRELCERLEREGLRCRTATPTGLDEPIDPIVGQVVRPSLPFRQIASVVREAATAITREADARRVDLIVMATHGRSGLGRWVYGDEAVEILHRSSIPVLLVRAGAPDTLPEGEPLRILVPLDGSALGETALESAVTLARLLGGSLVLVQAIPTLHRSGVRWLLGPLVADPAEHASLQAAAESYLQGVRGTLAEQGVRADVVVVEGDTAVAIARAARSEGCALVALATHGRTGLARLAIGSVAEAIMATASTPVLVVRPADVPEERPLEPTEHEAPAASAAGPIAAAGSPTVAVPLSQEELELLRTALESLLQTVSRDEHLIEPIQRLIARLSEASPIGGSDRA